MTTTIARIFAVLLLFSTAVAAQADTIEIKFKAGGLTKVKVLVIGPEAMGVAGDGDRIVNFPWDLIDLEDFKRRNPKHFALYQKEHQREAALADTAVSKKNQSNRPFVNAEAELKRLKASFPAYAKSEWKKKFEYTVPDEPTWADLRGYITTATLQSLPVSIQRLEDKVAAQKKVVRQALKETNGYTWERAKAEQALSWFDDVLEPYLAELRALSKRR
jgi:hypothetical protein